MVSTRGSLVMSLWASAAVCSAVCQMDNAFIGCVILRLTPLSATGTTGLALDCSGYTAVMVL